MKVVVKREEIHWKLCSCKMIGAFSVASSLYYCKRFYKYNYYCFSFTAIHMSKSYSHLHIMTSK